MEREENMPSVTSLLRLICLGMFDSTSMVIDFSETTGKMVLSGKQALVGRGFNGMN